MKFLSAVVVFCLLAACSSTRETALSSTSENKAKADHPEAILSAKSTASEAQDEGRSTMLGTWVVHTMQRQATLSEETLNINLQLYENKTFVAATGCGEMKGKYSTNGTEIHFKNASYKQNNCENHEQLDEMVRLLTQNVSHFSVNGNMLFLKDNAGNNVFRVIR